MNPQGPNISAHHFAISSGKKLVAQAAENAKSTSSKKDEVQLASDGPAIAGVLPAKL